jgi:hypothetical protein
MTKSKHVLAAIAVLLFVDGLFLLAGSHTRLAQWTQLPLWTAFMGIMYLEDPERFHQPVSRRLALPVLAVLAALAVWGLTTR